MAQNIKKKLDVKKVRNQVLTCGLAVLLIIITTLAVWTNNNIYNPDRFSNQLVNAMRQEETRNAIGSEVANKLYDDKPVLSRLLSQPTQSLVSAILVNDRFSNILDKLASNINERITSGNNQPIVVDISGFTTSIQSLAKVIAPEKDLNIPTGEDAKIVLLKPNNLPNLKKIGQFILTMIPFLLISLIVLTAVSWLKNKSKTTFFKMAGIVLIISGSLLYIITYTATAQLSLLAENSNQKVILQSIYDNFLDNLFRYEKYMFTVGVIILVIVYIFIYKNSLLNVFDVSKLSNKTKGKTSTK